MKKKIVYRFFIFVLFFIVSASGMGIYAHMVAKQLPGEIYLQNICSGADRQLTHAD